MLAGRNGLEHQFPRHAAAADEFDDDVDRRVRDDLARIGDDSRAIADQRLRFRHVAPRHHRQLDAAARASLDLFLIALQHLEHAAAHGTEPHQAHLDGFHVGAQLE